MEQIKEITSIVDILINNAGVMATREFVLSKDGVESQFAANYLGHFLLTNLLLKEGLVKPGGVVLNVGSLGYQMANISFDDLNFKVCICRLASLLMFPLLNRCTEWYRVQWLEGLWAGQVGAAPRYSRACKPS